MITVFSQVFSITFLFFFFFFTSIKKTIKFKTKIYDSSMGYVFNFLPDTENHYFLKKIHPRDCFSISHVHGDRYKEMLT